MAGYRPIWSADRHGRVARETPGAGRLGARLIRGGNGPRALETVGRSQHRSPAVGALRPTAPRLGAGRIVPRLAALRILQADTGLRTNQPGTAI